jgi:hypothetical protein
MRTTDHWFSALRMRPNYVFRQYVPAGHPLTQSTKTTPKCVCNRYLGLYAEWNT